MKCKHILLALIPCIMASSCKKQDIPLFESEISGIYFQRGDIMRNFNIFYSPDNYYDSTAFSFTVAPASTMDTILRTRVAVMGKLKDYPRPFKVSADHTLSTAVEGKHYEIDHNSAVIPAGANEAFIGVKFNRTADMLDNTFKLVLKLEDNEHFKVVMEKQRNTNRYGSGTDISADRFRFIVSEVYTEPPYWRLWGRTYFGPWTLTKYRYVNNILGWTHSDWQSLAGDSKLKFGYLHPAAITVRNALQALADAGTPMFDEDGSKMQLGPNYLVKY